MAGTKFLQALLFLAFALFALAAPSSLQQRTSADVIQFAIELTWGDANPTGGIARKAILTNGTIPGPPLMMKVGQAVEFLVVNNLHNATAVHFHGISQANTPYSDGVPGVTQKPIEPGTSFLYTWVADEAGTYFYHAHNKGQMMDGLYGAIIISAADDAPRPFGLISNDSAAVQKMMAAEATQKPVFVSDWSQFTFDQFYNIQQAANIDNACADSIIINGKGSVYCLSRDEINVYTAPQLVPLLAAVSPPQLTDKACLPPNLPAVQGNATNISALPAGAYSTCIPSSGPVEIVSVDPANGWAAMTFINSGGFSLLKFTIDNHKLWVYAVNGGYVVPQMVDQVAISNGERYSVLVKLDQAVGQYPIRVANNGLNQLLSGYASLEYKGATGPAPGAIPAMNFAGINTTSIVAFNDALAAPYPAIAPAATSDITFNFNIKKLGHPWEWTFSGINAYHMNNDDAEPLLFYDPSTVPASDTVLKTKLGQWVDIIVKVQGPLAQPHPLHKHNNKAFVLGSGVGPFNYSTVAEAAASMPTGTFNFVNPPYQDGYTTPPGIGNSSWMALRYHVENAGAWIFHCHMQTHFSGGLAAVILDGVDKFPSIPSVYINGTGFGAPIPQIGRGSSTGSAAAATTSTVQFQGAASSVSVPALTSGLLAGVLCIFTLLIV